MRLRKRYKIFAYHNYRNQLSVIDYHKVISAKVLWADEKLSDEYSVFSLESRNKGMSHMRETDRWKKWHL